MIDGQLNLGGKELPFKRTLGAMKRFDMRFIGDLTVLEMGARAHEMRTEHLITLMFLFIEAGYKSLGKECEVTEEWLEDNVTMTELNNITSVLSGSTIEQDDDQGDDQSDDRQKKTYKGGE